MIRTIQAEVTDEARRAEERPGWLAVDAMEPDQVLLTFRANGEDGDSEPVLTYELTQRQARELGSRLRLASEQVDV